MKRERNAKQAFIEGTVRVVARDGLDKTTTKAIATEAGLSEAYIYRCFESKEALLCAAFHMEDVAFAYFLKQNLVGMHIQNAPWKDRAFQLWSASWRFILGRKDDCLFYLRYYYSANCRTYAYEEHLQCFQELFAAVEQTFKPEANVNMLLHQVLTRCCLLPQECLAVKCRMMMRPHSGHSNRYTALLYLTFVKSF